LKAAIKHLRKAIDFMRKDNSFEQLSSGFGAQTYEETIELLIIGIESYINKNEFDDRIAKIRWEND
jgi:hypothetical protein